MYDLTNTSLKGCFTHIIRSDNFVYMTQFCEHMQCEYRNQIQASRRDVFNDFHGLTIFAFCELLRADDILLGDLHFFMLCAHLCLCFQKKSGEGAEALSLLEDQLEADGSCDTDSATEQLSGE